MIVKKIYTNFFNDKNDINKKKKESFLIVVYTMIAFLSLISVGKYQLTNKETFGVQINKENFKISLQENWIQDNRCYELKLNYINYSVQKMLVPKENIGERLLSISKEDWKQYTEDTPNENIGYFSDAIIHEIKGISKDCAVAIQYKMSDVWYVALNLNYSPETLGQLIKDLNLQENLIFNYALYDYRKNDSVYKTLCFEMADDSQVWKMLCSNTEAKICYGELQTQPTLRIPMTMPILGYKNIVLEVWQEGYVKTNILETGKMFFIGEQHTQMLINYIFNECEKQEVL